MTIPFSERYATKVAVSFTRDLAIRMVGKGPYVEKPTEWDRVRFETWEECYDGACRAIIDEDLIANAPELTK